MKVYLKGDEVKKRLAEVKSELRKTPSKKHLQNTINVLSDPKLIEFSKKCVRFEARLKGRYLDKHKIPRIQVHLESVVILIYRFLILS